MVGCTKIATFVLTEEHKQTKYSDLSPQRSRVNTVKELKDILPTYLLNYDSLNDPFSYLVITK